jgi:ABC-type Fe3+ transport system permease subunit
MRLSTVPVLRYAPLLGHVVPTLVIGYGILIPRSCIAGWNELTVGFGFSVAGTCVAYLLGQRAAGDREKGACRRASS